MTRKRNNRSVSGTVWNIPGGLIIGVTGGIACGKSEVGRILAEAGVEVRDTDIMARETMKIGGAAYDDVVSHFGRTILREGGTIDRGTLGARVFADEAERAALNRMVHPHVRRAWKEWAADVRARNMTGAVLIPLLFEVGAETDVDVVWCVAASEERVLDRLARRGLSKEQARLRIASQMPLSEKKRRSDYVIENNGALEDLKNETLRLLQYPFSRKETKEHG